MSWNFDDSKLALAFTDGTIGLGNVVYTRILDLNGGGGKLVAYLSLVGIVVFSCISAAFNIHMNNKKLKR